MKESSIETKEIDKDGNKKVTTITTTTTDNCNCTETTVIKKRIEVFTPEPECKSIGYIESIVSEETKDIEDCEID